jgi:hypothetical protein
MTIQNIEAFTKTLKELLEYYHKPCTDTVSSIWLSVCNESLSDEQFTQAVVLCFRRFDRLPSLDEFVGLIQGDQEAIAELKIGEAWDKIMQAAAIATSTHPDHVRLKQEVLETLSPAQSAALHQLGGFARLGQCPIDDLIWRRREFTQMCKLHLAACRIASTAQFHDPSTGQALPRSNGLSSLGESLF